MPFSFSGLFQAKPREPETIAPASKAASVAEPAVPASEGQQPQQQHRAKVCAPSRCLGATQLSSSPTQLYILNTLLFIANADVVT
jgi:hypothetical protein